MSAGIGFSSLTDPQIGQRLLPRACCEPIGALVGIASVVWFASTVRCMSRASLPTVTASQLGQRSELAFLAVLLCRAEAVKQVPEQAQKFVMQHP